MSTTESSVPPPVALTQAGLITRFAAIGAVLAAIAGLFAYAGGWLTPRALTPASLINTFETLNGQHPGFRRNHAKGVCIAGFFEGNGQGGALSKASVFRAGKVPVIGRFAFAGGQPYAADAAKTVRSMALLFQLPGGEEWRTGMNNIPVFPVNNVQAFAELLVATAPVAGTGKPDPAKVKAFQAAHPESAKAMSIIGGNPVSSGFADTTYNSLNAFVFTNAKGEVTPVRWSMVPVQTVVPLDTTAPAKAEKNYLMDELIARVRQGPLQWRLIVTIGRPGDPTADATLPWSPDRTRVEVGTLTIDRIESEDTSPARDINFDPLVLPYGMAGSDDPLLSARSAAYAKSFTRRESEH
ncbi:MAG: catalase family peroxidase, partial [Candidatus Methylacidiphilales bacterium]